MKQKHLLRHKVELNVTYMKKSLTESSPMTIYKKTVFAKKKITVDDV